MKRTTKRAARLAWPWYDADAEWDGTFWHKRRYDYRAGETAAQFARLFGHNVPKRKRRKERR